MDKIKQAWLWLRAKCHNSETIVLARAQQLFGAVLAVAAVTDPTGVISGTVSWKQALGLFAFGVIQELARKHRTEDVNGSLVAQPQ